MDESVVLTPKGKPLLYDDEVEKILSIPKYIPKSVGKAYDWQGFKLDNGQFRRKIELICEDYRLTMAMRQLQDDPLDFSVLLIYNDSKGYRYIIKRYNGDHGMHIDNRTGVCISGPHIHTISEECQMTTHKDEGSAESTDRYKTLSEAVDTFIDDLNIQYENAKGVVRLDRFRIRCYGRIHEEGYMLQGLPRAERNRPLSDPYGIYVPGRR